MDTMNVSSSFSHAHVNQEIGEEEEFDVDEDSEGLIGVPKGRAENYTMVEDLHGSDHRQKKNVGKPLERAKCHGRDECTFTRLWRL
jgi:hypothetical protein